jgi:hypothetical protein
MLREAPDERRERLANVHELYGFLESELPPLFSRWRSERERSDRHP